MLEQFLNFASQFIESNQAYRAAILFLTKLEFDGEWITLTSEESRWNGKIHIYVAQKVWDEDFLDSEQERLIALCESDAALERKSDDWKRVAQSITWLIQFCA